MWSRLLKLASSILRSLCLHLEARLSLKIETAPPRTGDGSGQKRMPDTMQKSEPIDRTPERI